MRRQVQYGNTLALIGGLGGKQFPEYFYTIFLYDPEAGAWTVLDERLSEPKSDVTAFLVDKEMFPPC